MTRSTAREIAVHLAFELAFSDIKVDELLERELNADAFAARAADEPLYAEYPNEEQEKYIRTVLQITALSWTAISRGTPRVGVFPALIGWRLPSCV